jgi:hypothetical protein
MREIRAFRYFWPTPGLLWVSPLGDYAIINSSHIPDGTLRSQLNSNFKREPFY